MLGADLSWLEITQETLAIRPSNSNRNGAVCSFLLNRVYILNNQPNPSFKQPSEAVFCWGALNNKNGSLDSSGVVAVEYRSATYVALPEKVMGVQW